MSTHSAHDATRPASTCGHCSRPGDISADQTIHSSVNGARDRYLTTTLTRFNCPCGNE